MMFYLGIHHASQRWFDLDVPVFISTRTLKPRQTFPTPRTTWALDSGGFTELSMYGRFQTTVEEYAADVGRYLDAMHFCAFVSPQDWMCEPQIIHGDPSRGWPGTHLSVPEHQRRTVENFLELRDLLGPLVIPVLQGFEMSDYFDCWGLYDEAGVDLAAEATVGVGSVCRRESTEEAQHIFSSLAADGLRLHGFGVKGDGLKLYSSALVSADSMSWSYRARMEGVGTEATEPLFSWPVEMPCGQLHPSPHKAKSCANCPEWAAKWRSQILEPLEVAA